MPGAHSFVASLLIKPSSFQLVVAEDSVRFAGRLLEQVLGVLPRHDPRADQCLVVAGPNPHRPQTRRPDYTGFDSNDPLSGIGPGAHRRSGTMGELAIRIYLTQHGLAVPEDIDPDRPLSEQGRQDVRCLAEVLRQAGIRVERLFHSGKTRAEQTAAILAEPLLRAGQPQARSGLAPNDAVEPLSRAIEAWAGDTLIVGHLPFLGRLASLVLAGDPDRPTLAFQPGSLACLERDAAGHWVLLWMVRPDLINPARE